MQFMGYRRSDGKIGIRNHILVLPASVCASDTARIAASQIEGAVTFHNQNGCSQTQRDQQLTMDLMAGFAANPNIYGTIVISLGCVRKGGHSAVTGVFGYAKPVRGPGLVIMDASSHDPSCVAAMAAGGAQMVLFSTGMGTPTGNPVVPVLKITGNRATWNNMRDNLDFDTSGSIAGEESTESLGRRLFEEIIQTANGKKTRAEILGYTEIAIDRVCNYT